MKNKRHRTQTAEFRRRGRWEDIKRTIFEQRQEREESRDAVHPFLYRDSHADVDHETPRGGRARSSGINRRQERSENRQTGRDHRERSLSRQPERNERRRVPREPREPPTTARYRAPREPSNPPPAHRARDRPRSNTPQRNTRYRTDDQARDTNRQYGQQQNRGGHWQNTGYQHYQRHQQHQPQHCNTQYYQQANQQWYDQQWYGQYQQPYQQQQSYINGIQV